jgi:hypothetical protein
MQTIASPSPDPEAAANIPFHAFCRYLFYAQSLVQERQRALSIVQIVSGSQSVTSVSNWQLSGAQKGPPSERGYYSQVNCRMAG